MFLLYLRKVGVSSESELSDSEEDAFRLALLSLRLAVSGLYGLIRAPLSARLRVKFGSGDGVDSGWEGGWSI